MGDRTKIDWCDATWNPVTGCLHGCDYCYARRIAKRFGWNLMPIFTDYPILREPMKGDGKIQPFPFDFTPTFHKYRLDIPSRWTRPRTIFVCSMADLFGEWVPDEWIDDVIRVTQQATWHRYLFLTKNPERYDAWLERFEESKVEGLDVIKNCWFGASASNNQELERANRTRATWLSIEPIRERIDTEEDQFGEHIQNPDGVLEMTRWLWVVIGAETGNSRNKVRPRKEWIEAIVDRCDFYGIPVFMKESLRALMGDDFRQEFPWGVWS